MRKLLMRWAGDLAERYPVPAGVLIGAIGVGLIVVAYQQGPRLAEFDGGARVVGEVVAAGEEASREPRYAADVTWTTQGQVPWEAAKHRALVAVLPRQLPDDRAADPERRLRPGSQLPLVISTKNPDVAMSVEAFEDELVLKLAGARILTIPLVIGLVCFVGGVAGAIQGARASRLPTKTAAKRGARPPNPLTSQARRL
jgi:hypothetical protein